MLAHVCTSKCTHAVWRDVTGKAPLSVWVRLSRALFLVACAELLGSLDFFLRLLKLSL